MKTFKISIIVGIIAFLAGKFLTKPKVKTVEVVKYITIEVEKKKTKTLSKYYDMYSFALLIVYLAEKKKLEYPKEFINNLLKPFYISL